MASLHRTSPLLFAILSCLLYVALSVPLEGSANDSHTDLKRDDTLRYVVYTKDNTNKDAAAAIHNLLKGFVTNEADIYVCDTDRRTYFFAAPLTSENAKKVEEDPNVGTCTH